MPLGKLAAVKPGRRSSRPCLPAARGCRRPSARSRAEGGGRGARWPRLADLTRSSPPRSGAPTSARRARSTHAMRALSSRRCVARSDRRKDCCTGTPPKVLPPLPAPPTTSSCSHVAIRRGTAHGRRVCQSDAAGTTHHDRAAPFCGGLHLSVTSQAILLQRRLAAAEAEAPPSPAAAAAAEGPAARRREEGARAVWQGRGGQVDPRGAARLRARRERA